MFRSQDPENVSTPRTRRSFFVEDVDPTKAFIPLSSYFLMSGFLSSTSFAATYSIWSGFMTGNYTQLINAIPRLFQTDAPHTFRLVDRQALVCLLAFFLGALFGHPKALLNQRSPTSRFWLIFSTAIQALCTAAASVLIWTSRSGTIATDSLHEVWQNRWTFVALGFISFSLGLQGVVARGLNTPFGATVVLTSTFVELLSDPHLLDFTRFVYTRECKLAGCASLAIGAFVARTLMPVVGDGETLAIAAGLRVLVALSWLFVPSVPSLESSNTGEVLEKIATDGSNEQGGVQSSACTIVNAAIESAPTTSRDGVKAIDSA
ncbi:hypothetical protein DL96DRAFT_1709818 [Flagelloscypha sp. PMI_526]|nr:hypothetical protein DL96DRAFT_1709818 [Flagelloscypha sp. PMI_526]